MTPEAKRFILSTISTIPSSKSNINASTEGPTQPDPSDKPNAQKRGAITFLKRTLEFSRTCEAFHIIKERVSPYGRRNEQ